MRLTKQLDDGYFVMDCKNCELNSLSMCSALNCRNRLKDRLAEYEDTAADGTPMRHGKWTNGDPICPICGEDKFKDLDADIWSDWKPKHCPNCGAKMDLERTHEQ